MLEFSIVATQLLADGTWSIEKLTIHYAARLMKFLTLRGEAMSTYSDYRKFQAESSVQFTGK